MKIPTVKDVEEAIGRPAPEWAGRCHQVSCAIVNAELVDGRAVYGHYHGPVAATSLFAGRSIVPHGWILLADGEIMDPTRWVFLDVEPEIWVGETGDYDRGGNQLRHHLFSRRPQPAGPEIDLNIDALVEYHLRKLLKISSDVSVTVGEVAWVVSLPVEVLEPYVREIYQAVVDAGQKALIPIDNREMILGAKE